MSPLTFALYFTLGIFLQGVVSMIISGHVKKFILLTLASAAMGIGGFFIGDTFNNSLIAGMTLFGLSLATGISYFFKTGIIRSINERYVLFINVVFAYFIFSGRPEGGLFWIMLIGTAFTLFNAFSKSPLTRFKKTALYVWLIFMSTLMMIQNIVEWVKADPVLFPELYSPFAIVIKGMSSCLLLSYALYLIFFLFFSTLNFDKELKVGRNHPTLKNVIAARFSNEEISKLEALAIIVIGGISLLLNHVFDFVHYQVLANVLVVVMPLFAGKLDFNK